MSANRRFRNVTRIGPVQVATSYDGRGARNTPPPAPPRAAASPPTTTAAPPPNSPPAPTPAPSAERTPHTVTVSLPLVLVLGLIAWGAVKFLGVRTWIVVVIALFGFLLSRTFMAPAIDSGTRDGVDVINGTHN